MWGAQPGDSSRPRRSQRPRAPRPTGDRVAQKEFWFPVQHATLSTAAGRIVAEILAKEGLSGCRPTGDLRLQNQRQHRPALAEPTAVSRTSRVDTLIAGAREQEIGAAQATLDAGAACLAVLLQVEASGRRSLVQRAADSASAQAALQQLIKARTETTVHRGPRPTWPMRRQRSKMPRRLSIRSRASPMLMYRRACSWNRPRTPSMCQGTPPTNCSPSRRATA